MDYNLIARNLLRTTDGLNNIEVDDFCLALGVDFEVIDNDGIARVETSEGEYLILTVWFDLKEDGTDALDVFYTVYELDDNDLPQIVLEDAGVYVTDVDSLAAALFDVHQRTV